MNEYSLFAWVVAWIFSIATVTFTFFDTIARWCGHTHFEGFGARQVILAIACLLLAIWSWWMYYEWK